MGARLLPGPPTPGQPGPCPAGPTLPMRARGRRPTLILTRYGALGPAEPERSGSVSGNRPDEQGPRDERRGQRAGSRPADRGAARPPFGRRPRWHAARGGRTGSPPAAGSGGRHRHDVRARRARPPGCPSSPPPPGRSQPGDGYPPSARDSARTGAGTAGPARRGRRPPPRTSAPAASTPGRGRDGVPGSTRTRPCARHTGQPPITRGTGAAGCRVPTRSRNNTANATRPATPLIATVESGSSLVIDQGIYRAQRGRQLARLPRVRAGQRPVLQSRWRTRRRYPALVRRAG